MGASAAKAGRPRPVERQAGNQDNLLVKALLLRAKRAKQDAGTCFEFVLREETTRVRLKLAPHQRLLFDFVEAHRLCVIRLPAAHAKTYSMAGLILHMLGLDRNLRSAVISASEGQAKKPVGLVRDAIENKGGEFHELKLVFPELQPGDGTEWTQTRLVIDRSPGIRDASVAAIGAGGKLPGARLGMILVDDILDVENTSTAAALDRTNNYFDKTVLSRRDSQDARIAVCNTPYDRGDLTYKLEAAGWPTLTMDVFGNVVITNTDWDSEHVRPIEGGWPIVAHDIKANIVESTRADEEGTRRRGQVDCLRLVAHDAEEYGAQRVARLPNGTHRPLSSVREGEPHEVVWFDLDNKIPLWPEQFSTERIALLRTEHIKEGSFDSQYGMLCRSSSDAHCSEESLQKCKKLARAIGYTEPWRRYDGENATFTGVDIALGEDEHHHRSCIATLEMIPKLEVGGVWSENVVRLLEVQSGRWLAPELMARIRETQRRMRSSVRVETNGAQTLLRQWMIQEGVTFPLQAHATGKNKHHRVNGVVGLFMEFERGLWLIPNDGRGEMEEGIDGFVRACRFFRPTAHTPDELIAVWLARCEARYWLGDRKGSTKMSVAQIAARIAQR